MYRNRKETELELTLEAILEHVSQMTDAELAAATYAMFAPCENSAAKVRALAWNAAQKYLANGDVCPVHVAQALSFVYINNEDSRGSHIQVPRLDADRRPPAIGFIPPKSR